jgi:polysaccharide deacetylase family protein (PEP-CTERM system associated)
MLQVDKNRPRHVFSVDVEDYFQVSAFERCVSRENWDSFACRVEANTHELLKLLADHQVQATFYILGWIADRYPQLVREIGHAGHEVGTHGYWHRLIYSQTPAEFRADLRQSIAVLENILDLPITAYRAPSFSITQKSRWALEILIEEGILADSSIVPVRHDLYGFPGAQAGLHRLKTPSGSIWEFPPAVYDFWRNKFTLPVGGGGYFRLYPFRFTQWCLQRLEKRQQSLMFYIHPWEVDPNQPRLHAPLKSRFRHYNNLHRTLGKLDRLIAAFPFGPLREVLAEQQQNDFSPTMAATPWL